MNKQYCLKPKAFSVFSGLLYLNDDFEGGEFIFADYKRQIQVKKIQFTIYFLKTFEEPRNLYIYKYIYIYIYI